VVLPDRRERPRDLYHAARGREQVGLASVQFAPRAVRNRAHPPGRRPHRSRKRDLRDPGGVSRLWALLVALCAVGILLASPFLLGAIRAAQSPMAPPVLLTLQVLQTLLLCALAAYAGVR